MSFLPYERYKGSGVQWLGEVPEHWHGIKLRWLSNRYSGGTPDKTRLEYWEDGTIPWLSSGEVNQSLISVPSTFITEEAFKNSSAKWVPSGALVMALAGQGKTKGMVAQLAIPSTCNQSMAAIVPREASNARFLFWWLGANYQNIRNMAGGDLRDGLNLELIGDIDCPLVPEPERIEIAAFLDRETQKIDALVEEQRRLIVLLKEKRRAVISNAVTKGFNPSAQMKDSGVLTIGEVPKHWTVSSLRYFVRLSSGSTPDRTNETYWDGGIPWVKTGEINYALITATEETISAEGMAASSVTLAPAGAMLLALYGQGVTRGRVALLGIPATFNQACVAIESDSRINIRYLYAFFVFAYQSIREMGNETTQMNLNVDFVKGIRILIPPLPEQLAIADAVEAEMASSDALMEESSKVIELLQERRSALISAAVTGKIDVRNYVPPTVAELEEAYEPA